MLVERSEQIGDIRISLPSVRQDEVTDRGNTLRLVADRGEPKLTDEPVSYSDVEVGTP